MPVPSHVRDTLHRLCKYLIFSFPLPFSALFFAIDFYVRPVIDLQHLAFLPSFEFINLVVALVIWSSRYPSVFWSTSKTFSIIFSVQMIANAVDMLLVFAGVSVLYKLQIVGQKLPLQVS